MVNTKGFDPDTGEWNDSLTGDFLWGNANIGEAVSFVMTPFTWSMIGSGYDQINVLPGYSTAGNIGGRPYQNGTVTFSAFKAIGLNTDSLFREMGGVEKPIEGLTIPTLSLPRAAVVPILFNSIRMRLKQRSALRNLPTFLAENLGWCQEMRQRIARARIEQEVLDFWTETDSYSMGAFWYVLSTAWRYAEVIAPLRRELTNLVGEADASALLSGVSRDTDLLASLGPVVGLSKVASGEMSRQAYLEQYGHRGPYETELAVPRPAEDPTWLDQQLVTLSDSLLEVGTLLERQRAEFDAAWGRFQKGYPKKVDAIRRQLDHAALVVREREAARSELTRVVQVGRAWAQRAGELSELGDDIFFLIVAEVLDLLSGKEAPTASIPARRETHARYSALPPYPPIIVGPFDPFQWAADPNRRTDISDAHNPDVGSPTETDSATILRGIPGSGGCVEGLVRRIDAPEEGHHLRPGEILVAPQTNIGWTLFFPRAAAVVTDVGAPLSHAAIVARELGIPAVVNCGTATARLHTGDLVRVDGVGGTVEILEARESSEKRDG